MKAKFAEEMVLVEMEFGSSLYGTNTSMSDIDYAGIFMPSLRDIILGNGKNIISKSPNGKNGIEDVDRTMYSLASFLDNVKAGNLNAFDMLHSSPKHWKRTSDIWEFIHENRSKAYSKKMGNTIEYCKGQSARYSVKSDRLNAAKAALEFFEDYSECYKVLDTDLSKFPVSEHSNIVKIGNDRFVEVCNRKIQDTVLVKQAKAVLSSIIRSYGHRVQGAAGSKSVDWKAISHSFRAAYQAREIYKNGDFSYPLAETEFIVDVKLGKYSIEDIQPRLDELVKDIEELGPKSPYPDNIDREFWDNLYYDYVIEILNKSQGI